MYGANVKQPAGVASSDEKGERHEKMRGGVAMGKKDATGADSQFNTGRSEKVCYVHERMPHDQNK
jgi:hypothetical protein